MFLVYLLQKKKSNQKFKENTKVFQKCHFLIMKETRTWNNIEQLMEVVTLELQ